MTQRDHLNTILATLLDPEQAREDYSSYGLERLQTVALFVIADQLMELNKKLQHGGSK